MFNYIFHVHTYRCGHASDEKEEEYILKAMELGANQITFTDHAPFPGDPFGSRMRMSQLPEYIKTLKELKEKYKDLIDVQIGLEAEYLPKFNDYYKQLYDSGDFDLLMIGQHLYQVDDERYSFSLTADELKEKEAENFCIAMIEGIKTGYFKIVAHPDRMFRKCTEWTEKMQRISLKFLETAKQYEITIEKNMSSMEYQYMYWEQFWELNDFDIKVIVGSDAHSVAEMKLIQMEK